MNNTSVSTRLKLSLTHIWGLSFPKLLLLLLMGSFFVHMIVVILFMDQPIALDDMFQYDMLARSIKEGRGYRWYSKADVEILRPYYSQFLDIDHLSFPELGLQTTFRAPGYPFFLAFIYFFVPNFFHFMIARLVQAGLAAALAPLVAFLCDQVGFSRKLSFLSAIASGFYPILLFYPIGLASENLYILLGTLSVVSILFTTKKKSWGWLILAGLLCGMTMFTRSIFAVFTLLSGIWISRFSSHKKMAGLIFLMTAFGFCAPWCIRNSLIMHKLAFVENSAGYNLFIGYHPEGDGGFVSRLAILPMNILDDTERERVCLQKAIEFIRQNPLESARRVLIRLVKFIGPEDREFFYFYSNNLLGAIPQPWLAIIYSLLVIPWGATLIFGIIGLCCLKDHKIVSLVGLFLIAYGLPHLFILAEPRFHLAWIPVLLPFAVFGWESKRGIRWKQLLKKENRVFVTLLTLAVFLFIFSFISNYPTLSLIMKEGGNKLFFSY